MVVVLVVQSLGYFQVALNLIMKARLSGKLFIPRLVLFADINENKTMFKASLS